jgi:hypothetical protein
MFSSMPDEMTPEQFLPGQQSTRACSVNCNTHSLHQGQLHTHTHRMQCWLKQQEHWQLPSPHLYRYVQTIALPAMVIGAGCGCVVAWVLRTTMAPGLTHLLQLATFTRAKSFALGVSG